MLGSLSVIAGAISDVIVIILHFSDTERWPTTDLDPSVRIYS